MKQSTIVFMVIFSLLITLLAASYEDQSKYGRKLMAKPSSSASNTGISATLTITNFYKGPGSGGPAECDGLYHSNDMLIVSLPTRWYEKGRKCFHYIDIFYNNLTVQAVVVDECDTEDTVVASKGVWQALQVPETQWGELAVTWSF